VPTATRTSLVGRTKILHVVGADRMNEATQNAFLKVLEEPPASVVWILDVEDESLLLETVVSRCRRVDFRPWRLDRLEAAAASRGVGNPQAIARAATGSPRRLRQLTDADVADTVAHRRAQGGKGSDDAALEELAERLSAAAARRRHLAILGRLADEGPAIVVPLARELDAWAQARVEVRRADNEQELADLEERFRRDERRIEWPPGLKKRVEQRHKRLEREERTGALLSLLDELGSYLRDVLTVSGGGTEAGVVNLDVADDVRRDGARVPTEVLVDGLAAISACREALQNNGNPVLQLERLLMRVALPLFEV
jgi:DNA polymerase-3 subunit delta'